MTVDRETWLKERRRGIGGSDWQHILNLPPWGCRRKVWYDKGGVTPDLQDHQTGVQARGHALEPVVAAEFEKTTGRKTRRINRVRRAPELPAWWIGNPDRGITAAAGTGFGNPNPGILEIKTVAPVVWSKLMREGIFESWLYQLQHYMTLTGRPWGAFAILEPVSWKLEVRSVEHDQWMQERMMEEGERFWNSFRDDPPERPVEKPDRRCANCPFRLTCWNALDMDDELVTDSEGREIRALQSPAAEALLERRAELKELVDALGEELKNIDEGIKEALGDQPAKYRIGRFIVNQYLSKRRTIDTKALRELFPDIAEKVTRETVVRSLRIT